MKDVWGLLALGRAALQAYISVCVHRRMGRAPCRMELVPDLGGVDCLADAQVK